jgi:hypothetical protein
VVIASFAAGAAQAVEQFAVGEKIEEEPTTPGVAPETRGVSVSSGLAAGDGGRSAGVASVAFLPVWRVA